MQTNTGHTLSGDELRKLQAVLRKRASNIRKKGKRQGLLRPLSKDDIGTPYSDVHFFQRFPRTYTQPHCATAADADPANFRKQVTLQRGSVVLQHAPRYLFNPEVRLQTKSMSQILSSSSVCVRSQGLFFSLWNITAVLLVSTTG